MKTRNLILTFLAILSASLSFFIVSPANSGSDENWSAKASWYLSENPSHIFLKSEITTYLFPKELIIYDKDKINQTSYPCWWGKNNVQSNCQNLGSSDELVESNFDRVFRSAPYMLIIGAGMHINFWQNHYETGRLINFMLLNFIILLTLININKSKFNLSLPFLLISLVPTFYLFPSAISPIGLEISLALLLTSLLLRLESSVNNRFLNFEICLVIFFLGLSRPLAPVWTILILGFYKLLYGKVTRIKLYAIPILLAAGFQSQIDNGTWRFNDGNSYYIKKTFSFYYEELIRDFFKIGDWIWQSIGLFQIGSSTEIPLIFLLIYVVFFSNSLTNQIKLFEKPPRVLIYFLFGYFVIPLFIELAKSADWPGWWSGRYQMPFLCSSILLIFVRIYNEKNYILLLINSGIIFLASILNFSRYNWGLYPTYTPIIINGSSFSPIKICIFIASLTIFALSIIGLFFSNRFTSPTDKVLRENISKT